MDYQLNQKLRGLEPYVPMAGNYTIHMDANESFLPLSDRLWDEIGRKIRQIALNRYPDPMASDLCASFAAYYGINREWITAGNGSDELLMLIAATMMQKGDKVITITPDFAMYAFYNYLSENLCISIPKQADLTIDVDAVIDTVHREQAKAVFFSNPCNPTSLGLRREEVRRLITSVNALVILDEAYMDFWDQSLIEEASQYPNLIVLRTCSKAFGLAGIRLGFAVANTVITKALRAVKSPYNVNTVTQVIGQTVLQAPQLARENIAVIRASRDMLYEGIKAVSAETKELTVQKPCTNFVFVQTPLAGAIQEALTKEHIAVRRFNNSLRITASTKKHNEKFLDVLRKSLQHERVKK